MQLSSCVCMALGPVELDPLCLTTLELYFDLELYAVHSIMVLHGRLPEPGHFTNL